MPPSYRQPQVQEQLNRLKQGQPDALKDLFWSVLSYDRVDELLSTRNWTEAQRAPLAQDPVLFADAATDPATARAGFQVIYCRLDSDGLPLTRERTVVSRLLQQHPYSLFIFSNRDQTRWHFVNVKWDDKGTDAKRRRLYRRITVGPEEQLRTASERLAFIATDHIKQTGLWGHAPLDLQRAHDDAFDVEKVTRQFFDHYKTQFRLLCADLQAQTGDAQWAHDYALQFLNRLMFLYFVQRKGWLGGDPHFLDTFHKAYRRSDQPRDSFVERWLHVMFFEAFNKGYHGGHRHFPPEIHKALSVAPFLNGGLFRRNECDTRHPFHISDERFAEIKDFLDGYNFTIAEDSPLDQEVAVDPEMIGKVYESLVNAAEGETTEDRRGEAGIFYTPRTEIDLMCRLALVDNLANHVGSDRRDLLYELVFALDPQEKEDADARVSAKGLWPAVEQHLQGLTVVDPACGSGSFLVGMLHILDDLLERAERQTGRPQSSYDRKLEIISRSLYGVDVMRWACHVAELRLWLALIIDAQFTQAELHARQEPLLPHFTFHIRCGDSLVEEVGGINLAYVHTSGLSRGMKDRIRDHRKQKAKFYHNDKDCEYKTPGQAQQQELRLFRDILAEQERRLAERIAELNRKIHGPQAAQMRLDGSKAERPHQMELQAQEWQRQVEALTEERERLQEARQALRGDEPVPFVWNLAFVEIFGGDRQGFDIVIGNPPYVRQEKIADPQLPREQVTTENKREYKAKLARAAYESFPRYFGYRHSTEATARKLQAKNDLYVYFYLRGLRLLNPLGSFCFITSNSWLDVGYGADLQEFLLRQGQVKMVIDNQAKRSFAEADVNTVIVLLPAPREESDWGLEQTARFVMFTVPFEQIVPIDPRESGAAVIFEEIEEATGRKVTPEYRLNAVPQRRLLEEGLEREAEAEAPAPRRARSAALLRAARYTGNKWGGRYLRAPEIYWTILEKAGDRLVRLGDIAEVRRGFTTGCNEFFYLPSKHFDLQRDGDYYRLIPKHEGLPEGMAIEAEYLRPVIKTPRDYYSIRMRGSEVLMFWCKVPRDALAGRAALQYVSWGESEGFHEVPSCGGRSPWYSLNGPEAPTMLWPSAFFERHIVYECPAGYVADKVFYTISGDLPEAVKASLNSSVTALLVEAEGYQLNHGGIFVTTEWLSGLPVFQERDADLVDAYRAVAARDTLLCSDEVLRLERVHLDREVLRLIGIQEADALTALHAAVVHYVERRIGKARRGTTRRGRMPVQEA